MIEGLELGAVDLGMLGNLSKLEASGSEGSMPGHFDDWRLKCLTN